MGIFVHGSLSLKVIPCVLPLSAKLTLEAGGRCRHADCVVLGSNALENSKEKILNELQNSKRSLFFFVSEFHLPSAPTWWASVFFDYLL
jgi:hypothetical protein